MRHATWLAATALIGLPFSNPAAADSLSSADADNAIVMAQIIAKEAVEARTKEISIGCNNVPVAHRAPGADLAGNGRRDLRWSHVEILDHGVA
jgi:hypothetical protein